MSNKSRKILFCSHESILFGAPRSLLQIIDNFDQHFDVKVISYGDGPFVKVCRNKGIPVKVLFKRKFFKSNKVYGRLVNFIYNKIETLLNFLRFSLIAAKFQPDVVYINTVMRSMPVIVAKLLGIPTLVHVREGENFIKPVSRRSRRRMKLIASADKFICISKANQQIFLKYGKVDEGKTIVVHNGIDTEYYKKSLIRRKSFRELYAISPDDMLIGFIGNVSIRKGTDVFVEAVKQLLVKRKCYEKFRFLIVGGSWEQIRKFKIKFNAQLESKLILIPFIEDVRPVYDAMDIFCMTSRSEPFGRTNIEASSMEKVIVATKVDGCLEIFTNQVNALMIDPNSPEQLLEALEILLKDSVLRKKLSKSARENVINNFSEHQTIKKIMNILDV